MSRYNPALIILSGVNAEEIRERIQSFICERLGLEKLPAIFQLVHHQGLECDASAITTAYNLALSKRAAAEAENLLESPIDTSSIETFFVAPLTSEFVHLGKKIAESIDKCALITVSGGRNAIFLVSPKLLSPGDGLQQGALDLDLAMQSRTFPFSRCFFIDEVNELGQTITRNEDLVDLVANFIAYATASELSDVLKHNPPRYDGTMGLHHRAYASFSCNRIRFKKDALVAGLSRHLAHDISQHLLKKHNAHQEIDSLVAQSVSWFRGSWLSTESKLKLLSKVDGEDTEAPAISAVRVEAQRSLDEFIDSVYRSLKFNLCSLRTLLERSLECWLTELERWNEERKMKKAGIAKLLIDDLLGITHTETYQEEAQVEAKWWQIFRSPRRRSVIVNRTRVLNSGQTLKVALQEHSALSNALDIHLSLFARLDLACVNIDLLEDPVIIQASSDLLSIFDLDLVDDELATAFYHSAEYGKKDEDVNRFVHSDQFQKFKEKLFSYPVGMAKRHLLEYSSRCFNFVRDCGVERICGLKRSFKEHKEFLYLSTPFWKPWSNATGERLVIVCCHERPGFDLSSLLDSRNSPTNELYVRGRDRNSITVIQISYGVEIQDVVLSSASTPIQENKSESAAHA